MHSLNLYGNNFGMFSPLPPSGFFLHNTFFKSATPTENHQVSQVPHYMGGSQPYQYLYFVPYKLGFVKSVRKDPHKGNELKELDGNLLTDDSSINDSQEKIFQNINHSNQNLPGAHDIKNAPLYSQPYFFQNDFRPQYYTLPIPYSYQQIHKNDPNSDSVTINSIKRRTIDYDDSLLSFLNPTDLWQLSPLYSPYSLPFGDYYDTGFYGNDFGLGI